MTARLVQSNGNPAQPSPAALPVQRAGPEPLSQALPAELRFLASYGVPVRVLEAAAAQARAQAAAPDATLLASGAIDETTFYQCLAHHLGVAFQAGGPAGGIAVDPKAPYPRSIHVGFAPVSPGHGPDWIIAPRGAALADLMRRAGKGELSVASFAVTTPTRLSQLVRDGASEIIAWDASFALCDHDPSLSARSGLSLRQFHRAAAAVWVLSLMFALAPAFGLIFASLALNGLFLATIFLRMFAGAASLGAARGRGPRIEDRRLPTYSIVVALHREGRIVRQLAAALAAIDYPKAKLDIKLVIEADDRMTLQALEALRLPPIYEIIVAPEGAPRTKPRALNVALPLLRGEYIAIFDAEDTPAPAQLREAAERFLRAPKRVACLQARLSIDNVEDSWLTRLFSIEYAMLFDVLHQGMAGLRLPLPLGGSSNHFRTDVLREVCGWDAWNVTEDADLGLRLARFGYRTDTLASNTEEEAPAELVAWLTQRRRWSKGWMQTFITLSRDPGRLLQELGLADAGCLVLLMTALVIAPPLWPILAGLLIRDLAVDGFPAPASAVELVQSTLWICVAFFGAASMFWLALLGMRRRNLLALWPYLPLLIPYYFLMSLASWLAIYDLIFRPFHWHKTEHGLARSSRRNTLVIASRADAAKTGDTRRPI